MTKELIRCRNISTEFNFMKYHVFVDHDFIDYLLELKPIYLRKDHRIHIFISRKSIDTINDESLGNFVRKCKKLIDKRIIIHVPRCDRDLVDKIYDSIGRPAWRYIKLFVERDGNPYLFRMEDRLFLEISSIAFFHCYETDLLQVNDYHSGTHVMRGTREETHEK